MSRTLLIIDDEPSIRDSLAGALSDEGYQILKAPNALQGIEAAKKHSPDLILLDIWMPEMDGLTALNEMKSQGIETPVIIMSGHNDKELVELAYNSGANDWMSKPVNAREAAARVREQVHKAQLKIHKIHHKWRLRNA